MLSHQTTGETFKQSGTHRVLKYNRVADQCTKTLERFLKTLDILRCLSDTFRMPHTRQLVTYICLDENNGFFRIPQVAPFVNFASRNLSYDSIARLRTTILTNKDIGPSLPLLLRLGNDLARLYNLEESEKGFSASNASSSSNLRDSSNTTLYGLSPSGREVSVSPNEEFVSFERTVASRTIPPPAPTSSIPKKRKKPTF
jgi:hypothetical protein